MIERLENNEQILLMHLAGELPVEDTAEVEQLLATDASLRRELESIRSAQAAVFENLSALDGLSRTPVSAEFAARHVSRAMRQRLLQPKPVQIERAANRPVRSWRWLYPTAVAASIAIMGMVWLSREADLVNPQVARTAQGKPDVPSILPSMPDPTVRPVSEGLATIESDDVLLLHTLQRQAAGLDPAEGKPQVDDDPRQVALGADSMPKDELSEFLLSVGPSGQ
ncbi:MAG TPA: hypothetical protein VLJ39_03400 [Tepidisphaeraceae bacterium]|nr:hypothetical protein [Tepidisphaeraceae bacterium]